MKNNLKAPQGRSKKVRRLDNDTPFAIREAFNQLRTNLMYTSNDQDGCPAYGITSAESTTEHMYFSEEKNTL